MAAAEADFWASARRQSAKKETGGSRDRLRSLPIPNARLCITERGKTTNRDVASSCNTLHEGSTRSDHRHHIAMHCFPRPLVQPRAPFRPTNMNARQPAPSRPSTRTPCTCQLTRQALAQLLKGLSGHAFAGAVPRRHGSRSSVKELRLVRLRGPESTSCPTWCRGRRC